MIRTSVCCMLAGMLLVFSAELYVFAAASEWHGSVGILVAVILIFTSVIGLEWIYDGIRGL